jgi:type 1 glutamine amidotransferase
MTNPKHILVFSLTLGYRHDSIPVAAQAISRIGQQSGRYVAHVSEDVNNFEGANLWKFDAVCFNQTTGEIPFTDNQKSNLQEFVASGRGFIGLHSATDTLYTWPQYGEMIGGYFDGHPWYCDCKVRIRIDDPANPLVRSFDPAGFDLVEEIYQVREPYDRSKLQVLMSLDVRRTDMKRDGIKRKDGDFGLAWTKNYGRGRVFYTALGHNESTWARKDFQDHISSAILWSLDGGRP